MDVSVGMLGFAGLDVGWGWGLVSFLVWVVCVAACAGLICLPLFFQLSLPLRQQERAGALLDLVEGGLRDGRTPEQTVTGVANGVCRSMGMRFLLLSTYIQDGMRLSAALKEVKGMVSSPVVAMLEVGEETGEMKRVIRACRNVLRDGVPKVRGATHYLPLMLIYLLPLQVGVIWFLHTFILPKFQYIAADFGVAPPGFSLMILGSMDEIAIGFTAVVVVVFVLAAIFSWGLDWCRWRPLRRILDRIRYALPWRRKRLHRDFCSMLGLMLDAGLPEERAVEMAGRSTANSVVMRRVREVRWDLSRGIGLEEALRSLDDAEEFHWRLGNATHGARSIWSALAGWRDSLDAKAFQQEQAVAQLVATFFVVGNGVIVGLMASSVFFMIAHFIEEVVVW